MMGAKAKQLEEKFNGQLESLKEEWMSKGEERAGMNAQQKAEADAAVEVEAAPPQAARLSAMAPAKNADTRRFIYGSSLSGKQLCFIALPC